jgi:hypothetical protein
MPNAVNSPAPPRLQLMVQGFDPAAPNDPPFEFEVTGELKRRYLEAQAGQYGDVEPLAPWQAWCIHQLTGCPMPWPQTAREWFIEAQQLVMRRASRS